MALTKALRAWREAYKEALAVRPQAEVFDLAFAKLADRTGIQLRLNVSGDTVRAEAMQPSGSLVESVTHSPDTLTVRLRAIEEALSQTYRKDRWR